MSNAERPVQNVEVLCTRYNVVLILVTSYLLLFLMSNAERRLKNVELGKLVFSVIRPPSLVSRLLPLEASCYLILDT